MRLTERDRQRISQKNEARRERCGEINCQLAQANSHVVLASYGAAVAFVHLDIRNPENPQDRDDHLQLQMLSDVEFDKLDLGDSEAVYERAFAMHQATQRVMPIVEERAVRDYKDRLLHLLGAGRA
jgi:hypothetical protein